MSQNGDGDYTANHEVFKVGQEVLQRYMNFLARQGVPLATDGEAMPTAALPDAAHVARLQRSLLGDHARLWTAFIEHGGVVPDTQRPLPANHDARFAGEQWQASPYFDYIRQAYLINARFLQDVAEAIPLADRKAKSRLRYLTRQFVDAMAPSNFAATNPEFVKLALETRGESITAGIRNLLDDLHRGRVSMSDESAFEVGRNLATTAGAVVYENALIQLIQYVPTTTTVASRPFLIVPPCINKFYVLDLQAENSFVRFMLDQGHTVFLVSWRNPQSDQGQLRWDDYLELGPLSAFRVVRSVTGCAQMNVLGFCVGGTLVSSALAVAKARGDEPAASLTLLTTLLDFSDAGEIGSLVDETAVAAREASIGEGGLLSGREVLAVFASLRANDLVWQYVVGNYLKGGMPPPFDILYWNSDSTNLPGPFLVYYLRHMYLNNSLRDPGKLRFCGVQCDLSSLDMPAYIVATREDHIVPWKTAYLSRRVLGGKSRFVLGASGHVAGIINPPAMNKRSYWTSSSQAVSAEKWLSSATQHPGSWWVNYAQWLKPYRAGERPAPDQLGSGDYPPGEPAPGRYVKQRM